MESKTDYKSAFFGRYDYSYLFQPRFNPWAPGAYKAPRFFSRDEALAILIAVAMGLQHAVIIAVSVAGSATLLYSRASLALFAEEYSDDKAAYLISASLIVSGVATVLQALHLRLPFTNIRLGSGVLSTLGTTATFAPIAQAAIRMMADDGAATSWDEAYGKLLGTWMVCALLQMLLSLTPPRVLRRLLPSFVAGVVITLIGLQAVGASFKQWGGGVECADSYRAVLPPPVAADAAFAYNGTNYLPIGTCFQRPSPATCGATNGGAQPRFNGVDLPYGSPEYFAQGLAVLLFLLFLELFGSPFLRNCAVLLAVLFGVFVSTIVRYRISGTYMHFWSKDKVDLGPDLNFLWLRRFPLGIYPPALIPTFIAFVVTTIKTIADVTNAEDASAEPLTGDGHNLHVQGGVLAAGLTSLLSGLGTAMPLAPVSASSGIISLTHVASRYVGVSAGCWLLLMGVIYRFGSFFINFPDSVTGGITTFLHAAVAMSGIKILVESGLTRRTFVISTVALGLGLGVTLVPHWSPSALEHNNFWPLDSLEAALGQGVRNGLLLLFTNGYSLTAAVACVLHLLVPMDKVADDDLAKTHDTDEPHNMFFPPAAAHAPPPAPRQHRAGDAAAASGAKRGARSYYKSRHFAATAATAYNSPQQQLEGPARDGSWSSASAAIDYDDGPAPLPVPVGYYFPPSPDDYYFLPNPAQQANLRHSLRPPPMPPSPSYEFAFQQQQQQQQQQQHYGSRLRAPPPSAMRSPQPLMQTRHEESQRRSHESNSSSADSLVQQPGLWRRLRDKLGGGGGGANNHQSAEAGGEGVWAGPPPVQPGQVVFGPELPPGAGAATAAPAATSTRSAGGSPSRVQLSV